MPVEERVRRLRAQTGCHQPATTRTSGPVAYPGDEPAGWCAVESRFAYPRLMSARVPWAGRDESRTDAGVCAVTCFVTRTGFRRRGVSRALVTAAMGVRPVRGARAIDGCPIVVNTAREHTGNELYVGSRTIFADAGFTEPSRPTPRRAVMRLDLVS